MLIAVFNKYDLQNVLEDLYADGIEGVTVTNVVGKGSFGFKDGDGDIADLYEKIKLEIVVSDNENLDKAMECIRANCQDLGKGAGKMWWVSVGGVERIRTGEKDALALSAHKDTSTDKTEGMKTTNEDTPCS